MASGDSILIVAGDPSGDLHGARLIRELRTRCPELRVTAVGGPHMRAEPVEFLEDLASRGMTGFWEPIKALPFFARLALRLKRFLDERKPRAVICVDYYGFNRRVLALAQARGVPGYYFISPQVWASRPGRVRTLKRLVRKMFVIFPFESDIYRKAGVPCEFVGHPLLDAIAEPAARASDGVKRAPVIGLLPGSRASEVNRHLPVLLDALDAVRGKHPGARGLVFASPTLADAAYAAAAGRAELVRESDYRRRRELDVALCSSGTATLENALLGLPMVVVYKMSWPTYAVARAVINVDCIAMANILAGRKLVPELIQADATPARVAAEALAFLDDPQRRHEVSRGLLEVRAKLGAPGAAARAAESLLQELGLGAAAWP